MVFFFIAEFALTLVFKLSAWCLGKTCDGILYLVAIKPNNPESNEHKHLILDDDCVIITLCEYEALKQLHHLSESESESESESNSLVGASSSSSK